MLNKQRVTVYIFRSLWIIMSLGLIFYVLSQNVYTKRSLLYNLDFSKNITRDINGWYPSSRLLWQDQEQLLHLKAQPIYLRVYLPVNFNTLTVKGTTETNVPLKMGLKQQDGSWFYKDIPKGDFVLSYSLEQAQMYRRSLEFIISAPELNSSSTIVFTNNWKLLLER